MQMQNSNLGEETSNFDCLPEQIYASSSHTSAPEHSDLRQSDLFYFIAS